MTDPIYALSAVLHEVINDPDNDYRTLQSLTVMAHSNDPFRADTPGKRADAEWLVDQLDELGVFQWLDDNEGEALHSRGLFYLFVIRGVTKPDGDTFGLRPKNDWTWLKDAIGYAQWLELLDPDLFTDKRNDPPVILRYSGPDPDPSAAVATRAKLVSVDGYRPFADLGLDEELAGSYGQPFKMVFYAEKTSPSSVLRPLAERTRSDLYLGAGDLSTGHLRGLVTEAAADGRPLVVLCINDCDPGGWSMPNAVARKMQALVIQQDLKLDWQMVRVALTPEQADHYQLPAAPGGDIRRDDRWQRVTGMTGRVEIDAITGLNSAILQELLDEAIEPYYDAGLADRITEAMTDWQRDADKAMTDGLDGEALGRITDEARRLKDRLVELESQALNLGARVELPEFEMPEAGELPDPDPDRLADSSWGFADLTARLIKARDEIC